MEKRILEQTMLDETHRLTVEIHYDKGGTTLAVMMGYGDGPQKRGYWLASRREKLCENYVTFRLGDGVKIFLKETKRFSAKELASIEPTIEQVARVKERFLNAA